MKSFGEHSLVFIRSAMVAMTQSSCSGDLVFCMICPMLDITPNGDSFPYSASMFSTMVRSSWLERMRSWNRRAVSTKFWLTVSASGDAHAWTWRLHALYKSTLLIFPSLASMLSLYVSSSYVLWVAERVSASYSSMMLYRKLTWIKTKAHCAH